MKRFMSDYALGADDALLLTSTAATAAYFEECARESANPRAAANWVMGDLARALKNSGGEIGERSPPGGADPDHRFGGDLGKIAKTVVEEMVRTGEPAVDLIGRMGLRQVSDEASLVAVIDKVIAANPKQLEEYRSGKTRVIAYFVGQVMKETRGQANPRMVNELLERKLAGGST